MADSKGDGGGGRCYVGAIDQGTGSSRFLVSGGVLQCIIARVTNSTLPGVWPAVQTENHPQDGDLTDHYSRVSVSVTITHSHVSHATPTSRFEADPEELVRSVEACIEEVWQECEDVRVAGLRCVGIANQRETTVVWDKTTGQCLYNAIGEGEEYCHIIWTPKYSPFIAKPKTQNP